MNGDDSKNIKNLLDTALEYALKGSGPFKGARELADEYLNDTGFSTYDRRVDILIKREVSKSFGSGFLTGLGSGVTLPLSIPVSLFSSLIGEARLVATIALIYGHSLESDHVRSMIVLSLAGKSLKDVLKSSGVDLANRAVSETLKGLSGSLIKEMAEKAGFTVIKRLTGSSSINVTRIVPVAGGITGGIIDAISTAAAGRAARRLFRKKGECMSEKIELTIPVSRVSEYLRNKIDSIKNLELTDNGEFSLSVWFLPFRIGIRFEEFADGFLKLSVAGGSIRRRIVTGLLKRSLGRSSYEMRENVNLERDSIRISLNELIDEFMKELPVTEISGIRVSGAGIIVEID